MVENVVDWMAYFNREYHVVADLRIGCARGDVDVAVRGRFIANASFFDDGVRIVYIVLDKYSCYGKERNGSVRSECVAHNTVGSDR